MNLLLRWTAFALVGACASIGAAIAQSYPNKPVRMVVGFPPGGGTDVVARVISQKLSEWYGQSVVVENRPGATGTIGAVRKAMDAANHPALLLDDTISSLASIDYRHDEWGVDVTVAGSQKGLMLPPGLSFNAISEKARKASQSAKLPKSYWGWDEMIANNATGYFPYTPATNLLYGLREALRMLREEGLENVFARHDRHAEATRRAVRAWGLEVLCAVPEEYSSSLTAVMTPVGHDADKLRKTILEAFDMSLGTGLGKLAGKVFRIGHLGDFNDLTLAGTLAGVEMGLELARVPHRKGGAQAGMDYLVECARKPARKAA